MSDLIDRQAAIDEIDEWIKAFLEIGHKESAADACLIQDGIIQLPSAQPQACDDAISRDDAIMAVKTGALSAATIFGRTDEGATAYYETVKAIKALPSAQPERKRGKWILTEDDNYEYCTCSECGYQNGENWMSGSDIPFCANCGADMRGGQE